MEGVGQCSGVHRERRHGENLGDLGVGDPVVAQKLVVRAVDGGWRHGGLDRELDHVGAAPRDHRVEVFDETAAKADPNSLDTVLLNRKMVTKEDWDGQQTSETDATQQ